MAKTRTTIVGVRLLSETARWPASWAGVPEDALLGRALIGVFLPFLEALVASGAAPTTLRRHFGNVWVLGGHIVRRVSIEEGTRQTAARDQVLAAIDENGGPRIADSMTEEEQASFDSTCRTLLRFLRGHAAPQQNNEQRRT
jgi:hypothetical protein